MDVFKDYKRLIINNPLYIAWFIFYLYLSVRMLGIFATLTLYAISISIALSPLGEKLLRFIEKVRPLYTKREKEYLIPIYEEVYNEVREAYPQITDVELCVIDTVAINACAIGRKTIAVSKGTIETFTEEELKALITHEFSHIINGDTIATLLTTIGNGIFTVLMLIIKSAISATEIMEDKADFWKSLTKIIKTIFSIIVFIFMFVGELILSIDSRKNEYRADKLAYEIGYGNNMIDALYLLEKINLSDNRSIVARITASHPIIAKRIGELEKLSDMEE